MHRNENKYQRIQVLFNLSLNIKSIYYFTQYQTGTYTYCNKGETMKKKMRPTDPTFFQHEIGNKP